MYINFAKYFIYILFYFNLLLNSNANSSNQNILHSSKNLSDYFSGIISSINNDSKLTLKYFDNLENHGDNHGRYVREKVFALVQEKKIPEVFIYLKQLKKVNVDFFNANLLLGINYLLEKNYKRSSVYFEKIIRDKRFSSFEVSIAQILFSYVKVFENNLYNYKPVLKSIPTNYQSFALISDTFINCYINNQKVDLKFLELIDPNKLNFNRYNFFYINFLISENRNDEVINFFKKSDNQFNQNLLLKQTQLWIEDKNSAKIKEIFDCNNPNHLISEFFYLLGNLHSGKKNYKLSNFYLHLSHYLNSKFTFNKILLAENFYYLENYEKSKNIYSEFDSKNKEFHWYAKKRIVWIINKIKNKETAVNLLKKSFNKLKNPNVNHYYDLANFYKDFEKYQKSIEYYTIVLNNISKEHQLYSKVLHRRGMSYERLKLYEESEKDLIESLRSKPEEPYVLNYLAYSWLERNVNLDRSIEMLKVAYNIKSEDPYIIDSLGWGLYLLGRYNEAEKFLQTAVELMPLDPVVNDHYADILWKQNKNLQANYLWNYVLSLEETDKEMKDKIKKKLILNQ